MAFLLNEVGIERGATKLLFSSPPIIEERHREGGPSVAYELSIDNTPVVVNYAISQDKAYLKIRMEQLTQTQVNTIEQLMGSTGLVTVKLKPGVTTTIVCAFGPRSEQSFEPYNGPYPESNKAGGTLTPILTAYRVTLMLLRM